MANDSDPSPGARSSAFKATLSNWGLPALWAAWIAFLQTETGKRTEPEYAWVINGAFIAFILVMGLPRLLAYWRESSRRRHLARSNVPPGYFVIGPRPAPKDNEPITYTLPGDAHEKALHWICTAASPVLHLTGRSGTGKSSLLTAFIAPHLQRGTGPDGKTWHILSMRCTGDPLTDLTAALPGVWKRPPADLDEKPLTEQIRAAAAYLQEQRPARPLLIILDQFEALAVRPAEDAAQREIVTALNDLYSHPAPGLRLLLGYRADFSALVDTLALTAPASRHSDDTQRTLFELSPFSVPAAQRFIEDSRLSITDSAALVAEAASVDSESDLVRPIVLNLLGCHLRESPNEVPRLFRSRLHILYAHLSKHAFKSEDIPLAYTLLPRLIARTTATPSTPAEPNPSDLPAADLLRQATTAELSTETKLPARRIEDYLSRLDESGLIRRLSDTPVRWEIAHDFIAKLLQNLLGSREGHGWRIFKRTAFIAIHVPALAAIFLAVAFWQRDRASKALGSYFKWTEDTKAAEAELRTVDSGLRPYSVAKLTSFDTDMVNALRVLEVESLTIEDCHELDNIGAIKELPALKFLKLNGHRGFTISGGWPPQLDKLDLSRSKCLTGIRDFPSGVSELSLGGWIELTSLEGLPKGVRTLDLKGCSGLKSLAGIPASVQRLDLAGCSGLKNLADIPAGVEALDLSGWIHLINLKEMPQGVMRLYLKGCTALENVDGLPPSIERLDLSGCTRLKVLTSLPNSLNWLGLSGSNRLMTIERLPGGLLYADFEDCTDLERVGSLPYGLKEAAIRNTPKLPEAVKAEIRAIVKRNGGRVWE